MYYAPHEKTIFSPKELPDRRYDPLALDRLLTIKSKGRFPELIERYRPIQYGPDGKPTTGDISKEGIKAAEIDRAEAETELVSVVRLAFELPEFPDCTDGQVLEILHEYLWWMEGKGSREGTMPSSPQSLDSSLPVTE